MPGENRARRSAAGWLSGAVLGGRVAQPQAPRPVPLPAPGPAAPPDGAEPAADTAALGAAPADPQRRLPYGMAKLLVQPARDRDGNRAYLLTGAAGDGTRLPDAPAQLPPTGIALSRLRRDGGTDDAGPGFPSEFYRAVVSWSRRQRPLVRWLADLRARHGEELHVVVWDDTDFEIPWELLTLTPPDDTCDVPEPVRHQAPGEDPHSEGDPDPGPGQHRDTDPDAGRDPRRRPGQGPHRPAAPGQDCAGPAYGPLGALVAVARWTSTCEEAAPLLDGPARCSGGVLGYFDEEMRSDTAGFADFAHEPHEDPDAFLAALTRGARADRPLGLVYMGCHGTHGKGLEHLKAGVLTWYELDEHRMHALSARATAVVLNVCHSGRMVRNHVGGEDALRGFTEMFLRHGATACIATHGEVGDTVARTLLTYLVDYTRRTPERPLALMLRDFRARAAAGLPRPLPRTRARDHSIDYEGQRRVLSVLYQFMYVYYGHPRTTLRLAPRAPDTAA